MSAVVEERTIQCASDPAQIWCVIADTERLNRAVGLGALKVSPNDDATAARYVVSTVSGGFPLEYEERPFEWVENERFVVKRIVKKGLAHSMENAFELRPRPDGGTDLQVRISIEPKVGILMPFVRIQVRRFLARIAREIERVDAELRAGRKAGVKLDGTRADGLGIERAAVALAERVPGRDRELVELLARFVTEASDADVSRIRPFELADAWQADRRRVLSMCLEAVRAGLLELHWDLVCPSCRTAADRIGALANLPKEGHCQLCDITFELELDRAVEATFRPSPGLRIVDEGPYCIGGPSRSPHVYAQALVAADQQVVLRAPTQPARYRLFARGGATAALDVKREGQSDVEVELADGTLEPGLVELAPGGNLKVLQRGGSERHVKIERLDYGSRAATAHYVSTLPEFRRDFASELLRPGLTLRVAKVALLFTDLTNSTALYTEVGDAKAFSVVHEHFALLGDIVAGHSGTIVKTIGDSVMAAFVREEDAVRAAVAMHRAFGEFRTRTEAARHNHLKLGVFAGSCYVVTANGILDYFGQSVNVAARLQAAAAAGEIVLPEDLADEAARLGWLESYPIGERFDALLKGLAGPLRAARVRVDALRVA